MSEDYFENWIKDAMPWRQSGNRRCITGLDILKNKRLQKIIEKYPHRFERQMHSDCYFLIEAADAN